VSKVWQPAYVGIGSNLAEPRTQVLRAIDRLQGLDGFTLVLRSRLYGSRPLGSTDQPDYVNAVVGGLTDLEPHALLAELRALEQQFGRPRTRPRWGPRVLDLDLLALGRARCDDPQLSLPHPGIPQRNFVLYPLADVAPDLDVPGLGRVAVLKARVSRDGIWPIDPDAARGVASRSTL
jgi:2-amino-4-hydroxy-6-hydroxymethyldihydropteridine diphosphokinase